jgi:uncharacterized repeat protein (TIGR01451 family)
LLKLIRVRDIAADSSGNAYVTGYTNSANFPTQNPYQAAIAGSDDAFITKLNPSGSGLIYSTYLGGSNSDISYSIAADSNGNAFVAGVTYSSNFPTQSPYQATIAGSDDAFIAKLNPSGSGLVYSTYLGGSNTEEAHGIAIDDSGSAYVTGRTSSTNFPTKNPYQTVNRDDINAFISKLSPAGNALVYSTYLGGSRGWDIGNRIAVDESGNAYVVGEARSFDFPTKNALQAANAGGACDAFVTELCPAGNELVYSTYLGSNGGDYGFGLAIDRRGNTYVTGQVESTNFPTKNAYQAAYGGGHSDIFIAAIGENRPYDPQIEINKAANLSEGVQSAILNFDIRISNIGNVDFVSVSVEDLLPQGLDYVSDDSGLAHNQVGNSYNWDFGRLDSCKSVRFNLTARINGDKFGDLVNIVNVTGKPEYGDPVKSSATASVHANEAKITVTKTADRAIGFKGDPINFTLTVTNNGNASLAHVFVSDLLPAGLVYDSSSPGGTKSRQYVNWTDIGPLVSGASRALWIEAGIDGSAFGTLTNRVNVTGTPEHGDKVKDNATANVHASEASTLDNNDQFCESQKVEGTGIIDVSTSIVDKKIALEYDNTMAGDGDIEIDTENAYSQNAEKLKRTASSVNGNNESGFNLFETTKMT